MPVDASIYGQIQPVAQVNPLATLAQAYQVKGLQSQADKLDRETQQQQGISDAYKGALGADGSIDRNKLLTSVAGGGYGAAIPGIQKSFSDQDKAKADAHKAELEGFIQKFDVAGRIIGPVKDQATWDVARQQTAQTFGPEAAAQMPAQYDPALVEQKRQQAMSVKEQVEAQYKALTFAETQRHNSATEGNAAGNLTVAQQNAGTQQGQLAVSQQRLIAEQTKPQFDSKRGLYVNRDGTTSDVIGPDGKPLSANTGKDIPANVNKSIIENQQNLAKLDEAIAAVQKNPGALGLKYMVPGMETLGQYTDKEGVPTRASVADIGSMVLHDRSGAAVTVSEMPRLKPFIPSASDSPEAATNKLRRFREQYAQEAELLSQTYSRDQGYKESPLLKGGSKPAGGPAPAQTKTIGGKTYANDGKGWYVVN